VDNAQLLSNNVQIKMLLGLKYNQHMVTMPGYSAVCFTLEFC